MKKYFLLLILLFTSFINITMHTFATKDSQDPVVSKEIIYNYFYQCDKKNKENKKEKNEKTSYFDRIKKYLTCTKYPTCGLLYCDDNFIGVGFKEPKKNGRFTILECTVSGTMDELKNPDETFLENEKKLLQNILIKAYLDNKDSNNEKTVIFIDEFTKCDTLVVNTNRQDETKTFKINFTTVVSYKQLSDILENSFLADE